MTFQNCRAPSALGRVLTAAIRLFSARRPRPLQSEPLGCEPRPVLADSRELVARAMALPEGTVLCQTPDSHLLIGHDGSQHTLVCGPSRSGTDVGVIVPTLLTWPGSVIVPDIRGEYWNITEGWRRTFSRCLRFEPAADHSLRFNPIAEIRHGRPHDECDARKLAELIACPEEGEETLETLLVAVILHVFYAETNKSLAGISAFLTDPARPVREQLRRMLETRHLPDGVHPVVAAGARRALELDATERARVLARLVSPLLIYRDPVIAANTSASDFELRELTHGPGPVSLYVVSQPSDVYRVGPVVRVLLEFFAHRHILESDPHPRSELATQRAQMLYLLDDFPSLDLSAAFIKSLPTLARHRLKCLIVARSTEQLEQPYGSDALDSCPVRVTYGDEGMRSAILNLPGCQYRAEKVTYYDDDRFRPRLPVGAGDLLVFAPVRRGKGARSCGR